MTKRTRHISVMTIAAAMLLAMLFTAWPACAGDVRFRNISTRNGLSNDDVNCIFKDSHGFMWFGTASGLNRYDGYNVTIFHSQRPDTTALRDNYVQSIQEDAKGNLWICAGDTYSVYNPETDRFRWFSGNEARKLGLPAEPRLIMIKDRQMWFVVNDNTIYRLGDNGRAVKTAATTPGHDITDIALAGPSGDIAAINDIGELFIINRHGKTVATGNPAETPHAAENFIYPDQDGMIWAYSVSGLKCFDPKSRRWTDISVCRELSGVPVKAVGQDETGRLWFGTDNYGIYILDKDGAIERLTNSPYDIFSLPNNTVKTIYNSGDGGMWVGTYKKGVSTYYPSEYKFTSRPLADVNCITRNPNEYSSVWVGTDHAGLMKYNYSTGESSRIEDPLDPGHHAITSLMTDSKGNLWIGTYQGGLKKYADGRFERWTTQNGLACNNIWAILEGDDGKIWLGTLEGGLQVYDPAARTFRTFDRSNSKLNSNYINTLAKGRDGSIYAGTTYGVARISPTDYSITTYQGSKKDDKDFSNLNINQVTVDSRGLLWLGTREGLEVYDIRRDTLYNLRLSERFPNPFILGIIEGADHSMWVTVGNEIFNIAVKPGEGKREATQFDIRPYGSQDGILSGTFNQRSMCLLPTGAILAGSVEGMLVVDPENITLNSNKPKVIFTGLSIKNMPVAVGREYDGRVILPKSIDYTDRIKLEYDENDITVDFATDNYSNSGQTVYKYKLEGFDDEWITCPAGMHHATYTNLSPGSYTLVVKAINSDGVESASASRIKIIISAPWWATWWAKLIYLITAILLVTYALTHFHKRSLAKLKERQQQELARKTEELNQLKFKFFTNISHELRTPLTLILSPVDSMLKEITDEKNRRRLNTVKSNAGRLLYLVNQLLDFRKNEMVGLKLQLSKGDIVACVRQACNSFSDITERRDITLGFETEIERLDMSFDNDKFTKMLLNLLSNAVKYTPDGGDISVKLTCRDNSVRVAVADTGKGISDEDKKHIFERFYRGSDSADTSTGTGIGLSLAYEYARLHGGSVEVSDNRPSGAVFTIVIPVNDVAETAREDAEIREAVTSAVSAPAEKTSKADEGDARPAVLFVDDNHDLIEFIRDEFGDIYNITTAYNGVEALEKVRQQPFDMIVTDLMMPEMDGIEFSRHLKSDTSTVDIPLIMLTAKQDMGSIIEGLTLGADDYITKPFNNEILALKIKRLLELKRKGLKRSLIDPTPSRIKITSLDEQLIEKAVKYVEENISRSDLSVEELAREMGMSRVHLYKKISALTGKSPLEFIRLLRLKRATQYLAESQLTIAEIAYRLGFNNPKYFSRYFKDEFGILPSEYQEEKGC